MRPLPLLALLCLTGCAYTAAGTATLPDASSVTVARGRSAVIGSRMDAFLAPTRLEAPADSAWTALVGAYAATGLPADLLDRASRTVGSSRISVRGRLLGLPVSTFLACGGTAGVAEVADAHHVQMTVSARVTAAPTGGSLLQVRVSGSAKDPFTSTPARPCSTTGGLEVRLDSLVRAELRGETLVARAPLAEAPAAPPAGGVEAPPFAGAAAPRPGALEARPVEPRPLLLLAAGGIAGGAVGTLVGTSVGGECETRCLNARGMLGPLVGNALLVPLGVHLSNRANGSLVQSFLASAGWAALGAVVSGLSDETWGVFVVAPGQLLTSLLIERATTGAPPAR